MVITLKKEFDDKVANPFEANTEYHGRAEYNIGNGVITFFITDAEGIVHEYNERLFTMHFWGVSNPVSRFNNKF